MMCYWGRVNDDMFETCVKTFRKHSKALLQVYSDEVVPDMEQYGIDWKIVDKVKGRRALRKIELLMNMAHSLTVGDRILVADVDLYFRDDPFTAEFKDIGLTERCYDYHMPINGGVFYLTVSRQLIWWLLFHVNECSKPTWDKYIEYRKELKRVYTPDWFVGQDFLNTCYLNKDYIQKEYGLEINNVGYEYNYCAGTDRFGYEEASDMIQRAYHNKDIKVLHLKSELKLAIYDGYMEDACISKMSGRWKWK